MAGWHEVYTILSTLRHFTNTNFCQFKASLMAKQCCSVTFCLINSPDLQFFAPTKDLGEKKIVLVKWCDEELSYDSRLFMAGAYVGPAFVNIVSLS